jgi:cell division protein FtsI/penicillin-binding protein 2
MLFAVAIIGKLVMVQIVEANEYQKRAKRQYEYQVPLKAMRGQILDRNGRQLATSLSVRSFAADPKVVANPDTICATVLQRSLTNRNPTISRSSKKNRALCGLSVMSRLLSLSKLAKSILQA